LTGQNASAHECALRGVLTSTEQRDHASESAFAEHSEHQERPVWHDSRLSRMGVDLLFLEAASRFTAPTVGYCLPTLPQPTVGARCFRMNYNDQKAKFFARTMHTPDDEVRAAHRAALRDVSRHLMPLHRALIDAAKDDYAFAYGPVDQPTKLLGLLNEDPFFAWLKPITSLIVDIDEMSRRDFGPPRPVFRTVSRSGIREAVRACAAEERRCRGQSRRSARRHRATALRGGVRWCPRRDSNTRPTA
jgi:hypothetical protein